MKESLISAWLKFLFQLCFSAVVSFLFTCGTILATAQSITPKDTDPAIIADLAIGSGMVMAAIVLTALFRRESSRLTKGMLVVLPAAESAKEIETDLQTIQKSSDKEK